MKMLFFSLVIAILGGIFYLKSSSDQADPSSRGPEPLALAWENTPRTYDPRYAVDAESQWLESLLHCSLINFDKTGAVIGDLAESWDWITPTALRMKISSVAKFADGTKVTAGDVKALYDFFMQKEHKTPSPRAGAFILLKSVEAGEDDYITFHLSEPDSTFISNLAVGIIPTAYIQEEVITSESKIQGCGPFVLKQASLTEIKLEANPHYSLGESPKIPLVNIKVVKDESTRFAKLRNGEIDIAQNNISREKVHKIQSEYPELKLQRTPGLRTAYLGFNFNDSLVGRLEVRKAINLAINRESIINYLLKGMAIPANTMLPPKNYFYNQNISEVTFDPEKADSLLDAAGLFKKEDGIRFSVSYKTSLDDTRIGIAKSIASDLKKIGIHVKVEPLEWGRFKADVDEGKVQIWSLTWIGFKDPDIYRYAFATESFPPNGGNRGRFSSQELDELLEAGRRTTDKKDRRAFYLKVQTIIEDQVPYAFLFHEENFAIMQKNIEGFEIYADGRFSSLNKTFRIAR